MCETLTINEIFLSIQGESTRAGLPCTMVRLTGCNLRCNWCDTQYAWDQGEQMSVQQVLDRVEELGCRRVEVTGGEPLAQPVAMVLLEQLCERGYETLLETNGSQDISAVDSRVVRIVDFKCPSSGQSETNLWANVEHLTDSDEVKFVIADREDYDFARDVVIAHKLTERCAVIFSPVEGKTENCAAMVAKWILRDKKGQMDVRLGLQLHKIIWPDVDKGV